MTITELLQEHRIYPVGRDGMTHLLRVMEFAANKGAFAALTKELNYIAPREDETILLFRDGQPDSMSFFWMQITRDEHTKEMLRHGVHIEFETNGYGLMDVKDYIRPDRKLYHGAVIYRSGYEPAQWSTHT